MNILITILKRTKKLDKKIKFSPVFRRIYENDCKELRKNVQLCTNFAILVYFYHI